MTALIALLQAIPSILELARMLEKWGKGSPADKLAKLAKGFQTLDAAKSEADYAKAAKDIRDSIRGL